MATESPISHMKDLFSKTSQIAKFCDERKKKLINAIVSPIGSNITDDKTKIKNITMLLLEFQLNKFDFTDLIEDNKEDELFQKLESLPHEKLDFITESMKKMFDPLLKQKDTFQEIAVCLSSDKSDDEKINKIAILLITL